ncbi:MAG: aspartate aminotransferase family protein, partial [Nitrospinota bacterium]
HAPKVIEKAISKQAAKLVHTSNLFYTIPQGLLARELVKLAFPSKALFVNSGAEAVESAIKLARKYHYDKKTKRTGIIAMDRSFHGRTYGALSATGQKKYHAGFKPLLPGFKHVPFGDIAALEKSINKKTAAVIIEPVQGEGGVHPAAKGYLKKVRSLCDKNGVLLIFDEVQSGMGRTGKWFAFQHYGVKPDIMTLAKGLAGGFPIGAMLARSDVMDSFGPGTHASTFGGGPLACSAALAVIAEIKKKNLLQNAAKVGKESIRILKELKKEFKSIKEVRGLGLMIGLEVDFPCGDIVIESLKKGLIINCAAGNVIRFLPPLDVSSAQMKKGIKILGDVLCKKTS